MRFFQNVFSLLLQDTKCPFPSKSGVKGASACFLLVTVSTPRVCRWIRIRERQKGWNANHAQCSGNPNSFLDYRKFNWNIAYEEVDFPNHARCSGNHNLVFQKALLGIGRTSRLNFPMLSSTFVVMDSKECSCSHGTQKRIEMEF